MKFLWSLFIFATNLFAVLATVLVPLDNSVNPQVAARDALEQRDAVQVCKAILIALKASAFCSSFVPIVKSTTTQTRTGPQQFQTVTITPDTATATATVTTGAAPPARRANPTCSIRGLPVPIKAFACDVIKAACIAFVKPGRTTKTTTVPGPTSTTSTTLATQTSTTTTTTTTAPAAPTCTPGPFPIDRVCQCVYTVACDTDSPTDPALTISSANYQQCAQTCDDLNDCTAVVFSRTPNGGGICKIYALSQAPTTVSAPGVVFVSRDTGSCGNTSCDS
ncbi:hypothetical protein ONS95_008487 [Cadophora gregata]|uniref:uncharacterized protein n=1 Tax=Cadophora gregata TaxID=51156 RepID=UPI0026DAE1C7|nr:uncharacterized protein ONS95_008487 [Cadophora gregata]KAK0100149.1 hypothetical protein ONS95_008487 [Cadophora gregata]KAK0114906.1 hypothetical protein ONS96_013383 [Cadophora gregata f. sp. sojae]